MASGGSANGRRANIVVGVHGSTSGSRVLRLLVAYAIAPAGTLIASLALGTRTAGYDATYSIAWGKDILRGRFPLTVPPLAPTPHPLSSLTGSVTGIFGTDAARDLLVGASLLALCVISPLLLHLLPRDRPLGLWTHIATAIGIAAIVVTSAPLQLLAHTASLDLLTAALVLGACAALASRHHSRCLVLLAIAGLQRPEPWLVVIALVAVTPRIRRSWRALVCLALVPLSWLALGALYGNPWISFTTSRDNAAAMHRETGLVSAIRLLPGDLHSSTGWTVVILGVGYAVVTSIAAVRRLRVKPRAAWTWTPAAALTLVFLLHLVAWLGLGMLGAPLLDRYLVTAQATMLGLALLAMAELVGLRRPWLRVGTAGTALAGIAVGVVLQVQQHGALVRLLDRQHHVDSTLRSAVAHWQDYARTAGGTADSCLPLGTSALAQIPVIAVSADLSLRDVVFYPADPTNSREAVSVILAKTPQGLTDDGFGPQQQPDPTIPLPPGAKEIYENDLWAVFAAC